MNDSITENGEPFLMKRMDGKHLLDMSDKVVVEMEGPFFAEPVTVIIPVDETTIIDTPTKEEVNDGKNWACPECRFANHLPENLPHFRKVACGECGNEVPLQ